MTDHHAGDEADHRRAQQGGIRDRVKVMIGGLR
jgi:hypothetical protein